MNLGFTKRALQANEMGMIILGRKLNSAGKNKKQGWENRACSKNHRQKCQRQEMRQTTSIWKKSDSCRQWGAVEGH